MARQVQQTRYSLRVSSKAAPALIDALRAQFGSGIRQLIDQASLKGFSARIFERTFTVTTALNALTLGVAGVALLTSLLTLSDLRLPQLAPLWAMGVSRRRLVHMELVKILALALITALLSLPLGLLVAWCLVAVVNVQAFGWRLPLHLFPLQWLQLVGVGAPDGLNRCDPADHPSQTDFSRAFQSRFLPMNADGLARSMLACVVLLLTSFVGTSFGQGFAGLGRDADGFAPVTPGTALRVPKGLRVSPRPSHRVVVFDSQS